MKKIHSVGRTGKKVSPHWKAGEERGHGLSYVSYDAERTLHQSSLFRLVFENCNFALIKARQSIWNMIRNVGLIISPRHESILKDICTSSLARKVWRWGYNVCGGVDYVWSLDSKHPCHTEFRVRLATWNLKPKKLKCPIKIWKEKESRSHDTQKSKEIPREGKFCWNENPAGDKVLWSLNSLGALTTIGEGQSFMILPNRHVHTCFADAETSSEHENSGGAFGVQTSK